MSDRIERVVELAAPPARVWQALTDHEEFGQWFRVALDGPFRVGGVSRGMMTYPGCEHLPWYAMVERMDQERLFSFSWPVQAPDAGEDPGSLPRTLVAFRLEPIAHGTRLTITESGFETIPDGRGAQARRQNEAGWTEQARNIAAHVEH